MGAVVSMIAFSVSGSAIAITVIAAIIIIFLLSCYVTCYQRTAFFMLCDHLGMYPESDSDETAEGREEADEITAPQITAAEITAETAASQTTASEEKSAEGDSAESSSDTGENDTAEKDSAIDAESTDK